MTWAPTQHDRTERCHAGNGKATIAFSRDAAERYFVSVVVTLEPAVLPSVATGGSIDRSSKTAAAC